MQKFLRNELTSRELIGASDEASAVYNVARAYQREGGVVQWIKAERMMFMPEDEVLILQSLAEQYPNLVSGPKLYAVTTSAHYFMELPDVPATPNSGLDQKLGMQVASSGEESSDRGSDPRFGGPPSEAGD